MFFQDVLEAKPDPIFGLVAAFKQDIRVEKVNLCIGIYTDDDLKADLIPSARKAKEEILSQDCAGDYLPIEGLFEFLQECKPLVFSQKRADSSSIFAAQTPGGTGALRVGAEFLAKEVGKSIYIPNVTWPNHPSLFEAAGYHVQTYPYYSQEKKGFDHERTLFFLSQLKEKSIVLFHPCCHNPTGCDPTESQWKELAHLMRKKALFPYFDFAYQGLGDGIEADRKALEIFLDEGAEMMVAYSCSKNFSMYCQRVGALFIVTQNSEENMKVTGQIRRIIRSLYSNPPSHGAKIVAKILKTASLRHMWEKDLERIRDRLTSMRGQFISQMEKKDPTTDFSYLKKHKGMFSFIDMTKAQVKMMRDAFGIYMTDNGRISISGLTSKNIDYVTSSLVHCMKTAE